MKRYLPFIIVGGIALATLGSGAMLYRAKRPQLLTIPEDKVLPGKGGAQSMHIRGNPEAPVTLEEFGDFQCPPCGSIAGFIDELVKEYDPRLRDARPALSRASSLEQSRQRARIVQRLCGNDRAQSRSVQKGHGRRKDQGAGRFRSR